MRKVDEVFNSMLGNATSADMGYVSNGLVFQIDGILDQSTIPQPIVAQWDGPTRPFTEYRGTVTRNSANNGWYFDGATCLQVQGNLVPVNYANSTIEIVFKDYNGFTKDNFLFGNGRSDGNNIIAGTNTASKFVYTPVAMPAYEMQPTTGIVAVSASSVRGMSNRELLTASGSHFLARYGIVTIGGKSNDSTLDFYGEIYAIRVYNRQLTKLEVIHNQILDYARFNSAPYTYYDYLESDGNGQYIDTGVYLGGAESIEIDNFCATRNGGNLQGTYYGSLIAWNSYNYSLCFLNGKTENNYNSRQTNISFTHALNTWYRLVKRANVVTIYEGESVIATQTFTLRTASSGLNCYLFACNNNGSLGGTWGHLKLGMTRMYDSNGVLVRDFRPAVRNADGVAGMHDVVNDVFYTNANPSGDNFLYGNLT